MVLFYAWPKVNSVWYLGRYTLLLWKARRNRVCVSCRSANRIFALITLPKWKLSRIDDFDVIKKNAAHLVGRIAQDHARRHKRVCNFNISQSYISEIYATLRRTFRVEQRVDKCTFISQARAWLMLLLRTYPYWKPQRLLNINIFVQYICNFSCLRTVGFTSWIRFNIDTLACSGHADISESDVADAIVIRMRRNATNGRTKTSQPGVFN